MLSNLDFLTPPFVHVYQFLPDYISLSQTAADGTLVWGVARAKSSKRTAQRQYGAMAFTAQPVGKQRRSETRA